MYIAKGFCEIAGIDCSCEQCLTMYVIVVHSFLIGWMLYNFNNVYVES